MRSGRLPTTSYTSDPARPSTTTQRVRGDGSTQAKAATARPFASSQSASPDGRRTARDPSNRRGSPAELPPQPAARKPPNRTERQANARLSAACSATPAVPADAAVVAVAPVRPHPDVRAVVLALGLDHL